jgi:subtilisin-like proprotein convertase family protein
MKFTLFIVVALMLSAASALACGGPMDTVHQDHRGTAKICINPVWDGTPAATMEGTVQNFLATRHDHFGLSSELGEIVLVGQKESLIAHHFTYQEQINGLPVHGGEIVVSIAKRDGRVLRTFNNIYPLDDRAGQLAKSGIDQDTAFGIAWNHVRAHGELRSVPNARLVYSPEGTGFRLNWIVDLDLEGPDGAWQVRVDATTSEVVELKDTRAVRKRIRPAAERIADYQGPVADRRAAFARIQELEAERALSLNAPNKRRAAGTGVVFDPDPRTTLRNNTLQDNSSPGSFTAAYFTRDLLDIEFNGSRYYLNGPWVHILNWDPPNTPPSSTVSGNWTSTRGVNSFNDAMTYFHLDQNQRYMQSLGFTGVMGIQDVSIGADTDGWNGADNSSYTPSTNRLTFGHGCVDDNEDADVILHEYGHAINYSINPSWFGGDLGAIGEGWGDYWAGSYSYSTPEGPTFYPNWMFTWDGHGTPVQCWYGRIMNAFGAQYVHSVTYTAHMPIPGGYQSDELWSTPLFQSMLTLVEVHGEPRESVDSLLLEAQFGLGSGLKMRDMANVIIATAQELEPDGPHAAVFVEKFLVHNIILLPEPLIGVEAFEIVSEPSGNGAADPGETVDVRVTLINSGLAGASEVTGVLTTLTPGVTIDQGNAAFPDLPISGSGTASVDFTFTVGAEVPCGTQMEFPLEVNFVTNETPGSVELTNLKFVGVPIGGYGTASPYTNLPDNDGTTIESVISISGTGATVSSGINVDVNITHDHIGDLIVRLISPQGTGIFLHAFSGGSADDIIGNFPNTLTPPQSLDAFLGQPLDGDWTLTVRDGGAGGTGSLNTWALYDITGFDCNSTSAAPTDLLPAQFALGRNVPNPFNPVTEISFAVPVDAGLVALDIFDVRGQKVRTLERSNLAAGNYTRVWNGRDDSGAQVSSGVYFYRLSGKDFSQTNKMVLLQ